MIELGFAALIIVMLFLIKKIQNSQIATYVWTSYGLCLLCIFLTFKLCYVKFTSHGVFSIYFLPDPIIPDKIKYSVLLHHVHVERSLLSKIWYNEPDFFFFFCAAFTPPPPNYFLPKKILPNYLLNYKKIL